MYCDRNRCKTAFSGLKLPNGVTRARDGLIYVASTFTGKIAIFTQLEDRTLRQVDEVDIGLPIDNISIDSKGAIFAAAFPKAYKSTESFNDPEIDVPSAVFRISRKDDKDYGVFKRRTKESYDRQYVVEKVLEDDGVLLPGSTAAVHDPQTGRIFLSSATAPFVAVCETR